VTCDACGAELQIGSFPFCPHGQTSLVVEPDDIPGGEVIQHCPGLHGKKFYSKRAIREAAKAVGFENRVYWTGEHEQHVQRMVSVDLTDFNDPDVIRARQEEMARHCGLTLDEYLRLRNQPVHARCVSGAEDYELDLAIADAWDRVEAGR
jgi:hypothetical protein